jgi:hypothetical protein
MKVAQLKVDHLGRLHIQANLSAYWSDPTMRRCIEESALLTNFSTNNLSLGA